MRLTKDNYGSILRKCRRDKDLTQVVVSNLIDMQVAGFSRLERMEQGKLIVIFLHALEVMGYAVEVIDLEATNENK